MKSVSACIGSVRLELCKLRLFLLRVQFRQSKHRLRQSKLRLRQGNFEEISYFKMEAEEREFSNLFPSIQRFVCGFVQNVKYPSVTKTSHSFIIHIQ